MAILGLIPWINPFGKRSIFRLCELVVFIAQEGVFSFQNIVKEIFIAYIALKKSRKNGHFWTKTPLEKCQFFEFLNFLFGKPLAFSLYCLRREVGKMARFGPIPYVNPFGKTSNFQLFKIFVFIAQKGVFSFQSIVKDIFLAFIA